MTVHVEDIVQVIRKAGKLVTGAQIFDAGDFLDSDKATIFAVLSAEAKDQRSPVRRHKIEGFGAFLYGLTQWGDNPPGEKPRPIGIQTKVPNGKLPSIEDGVDRLAAAMQSKPSTAQTKIAMPAASVTAVTPERNLPPPLLSLHPYEAAIDELKVALARRDEEYRVLIDRQVEINREREKIKIAIEAMRALRL